MVSLVKASEVVGRCEATKLALDDGCHLTEASHEVMAQELLVWASIIVEEGTGIIVV